MSGTALAPESGHLTRDTCVAWASVPSSGAGQLSGAEVSATSRPAIRVGRHGQHLLCREAPCGNRRACLAGDDQMEREIGGVTGGVERLDRDLAADLGDRDPPGWNVASVGAAERCGERAT